ncbi:MAG: helix-turn-helix transcriptional regulator [Ilumatobacteraceae bacterium]
MGVLERIGSICQRAADERELRVAVLAELRSAVPFDAFAWLLTDPVTCVGSSPVADVPDMSDLPRVIRAKYLSRVNRWTHLAPDVAATLVGSTDSDRSGRDTWCGMLAGYGIVDVASVVFRDAMGCWGFIDLWRRTGPFTGEECHLLGALNGLLTPSLRRAQLPTFATASTLHVDGPAVLLLDDDLTVVGHTERSECYLRALLPTDDGGTAIPAAAFNVAAQLLAIEAGNDDRPAQARIHVPGRSWMTTSAARITATAPHGPTIAVSIEPTPPAERASLYARVAGLTGRETDVLHAVVTGRDTRRAAHVLAISEHTVQDHLKAIFAKTSTDSRRLLIARATGVTTDPTHDAQP